MSLAFKKIDAEQTFTGLNEEKDDDENGETATLKHAAFLSCWVFAHTFLLRDRTS